MRVVLAVLLAPLSVVPIMMVGALFRGWKPAWGDLLILMIYVPFAYLGAIVCGLPLHFLLRRKRVTARSVYVLLAIAIALLVWDLVALDHSSVPTDWLAVCVAGGVAGFLFRAIVGPKSDPRLRDGEGSIAHENNRSEPGR